MSKIHFLFMMLGISSLTVVNKGIIKGLITKNEFIKKRSDKTPVSKIEDSQDQIPRVKSQEQGPVLQ